MSDITFTKEEKDRIVRKIQRHFTETLEQEIGQFDAEFLLDFFSAGGHGAMRMQASPTCPPEGRGPGGTPQGGARAPSGGELQGFPNGRRVIVEGGEATLLSPNESTQDGRGTEGNNRPASAAVRRRERR